MSKLLKLEETIIASIAVATELERQLDEQKDSVAQNIEDLEDRLVELKNDFAYIEDEEKINSCVLTDLRTLKNESFPEKKAVNPFDL